MNYKLLMKVMRNYQEVINPSNNTIGSVLKHHRKKQGLTLEETAESSCSISYLSKVENNQLIPSEDILEKIQNKLSIPETVFNKEKIDISYIEEILNTNYVPPFILNKYKYGVDYQSKLVQFAYVTINKEDLKKSDLLETELLDYYIFFTDEEMSFYLYIIMIKEYLSEQYENVIAILNEINTINNLHTLKIKSEVLALKSLYRLERFGEATSFLKSIIHDLYRYNKISDINKVKQYELATFARFYPTEDIESEIKLLTNNPDINFDYIWFMHYYYYKKDYKKAYNYIKKINEENEHFYIYYLITLDLVNNTNELKEALTDEPFQYSKTSYFLVHKYLYVKHLDKELYETVKKDIARADDITNEFFVIKFLYNQLIKDLTDKYLYKESFELLKKLVEQYERRSTIILYK